MYKNTLNSAFFLLILILYQPVLSAKPGLSSDQITAVDLAINAEMKKQEVVGVALGIIKNGKIVYAKGYGYADRENKIPTSDKTMFRWASVSKSVTAVAAMQLVDLGKLDLNTDVRSYVQEFPEKGYIITSRQLLSHQSGIVHYTNGKVIKIFRKYKQSHPYEDVILAMDKFQRSDLIAKPGTKYSYSTYAYILLSAVIQKAGNKKFADQVANRIAKPLGMNSFQPDYQWINIPNRAIGYRKKNGQVVQSGDTDVSWKLGGGGYISTIMDMARFAAGLINRKLVSEKSEQLMWTRQTTSSGKVTPYGFGFFIKDSGRNLKVSHNGSQQKAKTRMVLYPRRKSGMVVMSNSRYANPGKFSTAAYRALSRIKKNQDQ